jgi:putative phosphoesterase
LGTAIIDCIGMIGATLAGSGLSRAHSMSSIMRIGVISDTHNLVRPEALEALRGCERIIHAGDICSPAVLATLAGVAPVLAVRGNNDSGAGIDELPEHRVMDVGGLTVLVVHDIADVPSLLEGIDVVVTGHSHKPHVERRDGVLFLNPGSAGPRRFKLPVSLAIMDVEGGAVDVRIVELLV